jgi:signal transduction histidine kinase/FixJ family two-component response regulator/HPt (histidine-containing phosphotransfer) domain-containing protein
MSWSTFLYILSAATLCLGIHTLYTGRMAAAASRRFLFLAIDIAFFMIGAAWAEEGRSLLWVRAGSTLAGICINLTFPLSVYYFMTVEALVKKSLPLVNRLLRLQITVIALSAVLIIFVNYQAVEYSGGVVLLPVKNKVFYFIQFLSNIAPLVNVFVIARWFLTSEYKRDVRPGLFWIAWAIISAAIIAVQRQYFPSTYAFGCFSLIFFLLMFRRYGYKYHTRISSSVNLGEYIYSEVKTPIVVLARNGAILLANNSSLSFFRKTRDELLNMHMRDILDFGTQYPVFSKTAAEGNRLSRADASVRETGAKCEIEITYIDDKYKEFFYAIFFVNDMTDKVKLIEELEDAKLKAEEANRTKSAFLARMSHEIRTPLNAILGLSEVELQNNLSGRTRTNLEKIYSSGSHLLEIVNDVLDISKIESGNFEILPVQYEFHRLVSDTVHLNLPRIGSKPIKFSLDIAEDIPSKLFGDELRVRQILTNLLSNAFKYTQEGEVWLRISWERRGNTARLCFTVEDTGRGIRPEDMEKLFSEYVQLDAAANRRIEGTGLGLSITKGLVDMMGGSISAESEYGRGSLFRVFLPQEIIEEKPIGAERVQELCSFRFPEDRSRSRGNNLIRSWMPYGKVLVVDDLATNLDVMTGLLAPYGLKVDTLSSGRGAVERIRAGEPRYNIVFMDHMMPEMDGVEAVRIIRNEIDSEYARNVPIVVLTANAIAGNREMFLQSGFNDFISKPIDIKLLDMTLNQWIRDKQNRETLREAEDEAAAQAGRREPDSDEERRWLLEHSVKGVDIAGALGLYNGGAACMSIFKSFVSNTPSLIEKMGVHLESSLTDYAIEAHGLKGTCGAVCAGEIAALAKELETASKGGRIEYVRSRHGELARQALSVVENLKALLAERETGRPVKEKELRTEPEMDALDRLSAAAAEMNSGLVEEVLGELEAYRYEKGEELIQWLREQADNFEYDAIQKGLEELPNNPPQKGPLLT